MMERREGDMDFPLEGPGMKQDLGELLGAQLELI